MMEAKEKERYLRQMNVAELGEKGLNYTATYHNDI